MRLRLRSFLLTSALTFAPALASATTISGLYVDGGAGYNEVQDQHVHANSPADGPAVQKFSVNHGTGYTGFGAVGYGFGNGLRVEAEGLYNFSHDAYTSEESMSSSPVSPDYQKTKDLWVIPPNAKGNTTPYYLTVQKVDKAPEWMTNGEDIQKAVYKFYGRMPEERDDYDPWFKLGSPSSQIEAPLVSPNAFGDWHDGEPTVMKKCPDCYFVNLLTQAQVTELENGQLPMSTASFPEVREAASDLLDTFLGSDGLPNQGIFYVGDIYGGRGYDTNDSSNDLNTSRNFELPVSYEDGKLVYSYQGRLLSSGLERRIQLGLTTGVITRTSPTAVPQTAMNTAMNHQGTDESWGGFANVLYDFDLERLFGLKSIATPFIGGGAGYLWQRYNRPNTMIAAITGTHGGFSWQGIAGVAFDTGISGLQVVAQYRMIGQPGSFYNGTFNYGTEDGHAHFDQRFNHQFIVGFRYAFQNQPIHHIQPPAVRPIVTAAPAPVPARSYLVFFDWNQYALTSRARQIVVEAAHATSYVRTTRINVNGYTDSSAAPGPAGQRYNYALSVKRARSVEAELIRNGVPASEIIIRGYGDTNPLVPTAPNTREPQNRRVEIILHA